jgi:hypothetical protein
MPWFFHADFRKNDACFLENRPYGYTFICGWIVGRPGDHFHVRQGFDIGLGQHRLLAACRLNGDFLADGRGCLQEKRDEKSETERPEFHSDSQNHDFRGFDEGGSFLTGLESHLARRPGGDDRCDLLAADGDFDLRHQAADANGLDSSNQLVPSADSASSLLAFLLRFASRSEKQAVKFALRDAVMPSGRLHTLNFVFVNPLLDGGEAYPQLQCRVSQLQQLFVLPRGLAFRRHRNEIVQPEQGTVKPPEFRCLIPRIRLHSYKT